MCPLVHVRPEEYFACKAALWTEAANRKKTYFSRDWCPPVPKNAAILGRIQHAFLIEFPFRPKPGILRKAGCRVELSHDGEVLRLEKEGIIFWLENQNVRARSGRRKEGEKYVPVPLDTCEEVLARIAQELGARIFLPEAY